MDIKELKNLIKMVTETDITEFEMEDGEQKIYMKRGADLQPLQYTPQQTIFAPTPVPTPTTVVELSTQEIAPTGKTEEKGDRIASPIVGTFYKSPAPDAPPYVEEGQVVEKGQILCIVEAMKLMNEIEAEFRCKIVKVYRENAEPVEFGDTLFIVEKL